ncbi:MAG: hypothetical protein LBT38_06895, partial [Deltaproteobacteria bacterium]|nr:hypothetical protein [Deltaproteobacteria bacterium]
EYCARRGVFSRRRGRKTRLGGRFLLIPESHDFSRGSTSIDLALNSLSGTVFHDFPAIARAIQEGQTSSLFRYGGFRVNLGPDYRPKIAASI